VYDYRTDVREDEFAVSTGGAETTGNVTLIKAVYDDDTQTIAITSDDADDTPAYSDYDTTTRELEVSGLAVSTNRTLTVAYDIDALSASAAISTLMDYLSWIWFILLAGFPAAAIAAVFMGRR
jgi:predicted transcriptional regulator